MMEETVLYPRKGNVLLTRRDLALLESLYDNVVMTYGQLAKGYFANVQKPTVLNRLAKLEVASLISRERIPRIALGLDKNAIGVVFQITKGGISELKQRHPLKEFRPYPVRIHPFSLEHDLILGDVVAALKGKYPGAQVINGKHLSSAGHGQKGLEPDLVFTLPSAPGRVAVELELNDKSEKRYREIVLRYRLQTDFEKVLYLVSRPGIQRLITKVITNRSGNTNAMPEPTGKFYFAPAFEFINNPVSVPITNGTDHLFTKGGAL